MNFSNSRYSINEDSGPVQPVLILSNPSSTDITVKVFSIDIAAIGEYFGMFELLQLSLLYVTGGRVDYESGPYTVIIPAEESSIQFDISIVDDDVLEGNERFNLIINSSSLPNHVTVTTPYQARVIIVDNDGELLIAYM